MDPFVVLGISDQSTEAEVKKKYKVLALKYHPDKAGPEATAKFQEINGAYETIIEKKLYFDPDKATEVKAGQNAGNQPRSESDTKNQPEPAPPQSPVQPTTQSQPHPPPAQESPPCDHPQPRADGAWSSSRGDVFRMDFVKIQDILSRFAHARILSSGSSNCPRGWPAVHLRFEYLDDMIRRNQNCLQMSHVLGSLVHCIKMSWANSGNAISSRFVRAFSFTAMISMALIREQDFLTTRLWRLAEAIFIGADEGYNFVKVHDVRSRMSDKDNWLREMYYRVWLTLSDFLKEDRTQFLYVTSSHAGVYVGYKIPVALRCIKLSNDVGVSWRWLAVDVGMILLMWRTVYHDRYVRELCGNKFYRAGFMHSFDDLMKMSGLTGFMDHTAVSWMRATFYSHQEATLHPFHDMFIAPKWAFLARARLSRP